MNITDAIRDVKAFEEELEVVEVDATEVRFGGGAICAGDRRYEISPAARARLAIRVSAPYEYLRRLPDQLEAELLHHHVLGGDIGSTRLRVMARAGELVDVDRGDLVHVRAWETIAAAEEALPIGAAVSVVSVCFEGEVLVLDLLGERVTEEVAPGDVLQGGLRLTHSLTGCAATQVESFLLRLICSNGLTHKEHVGPTTRTRRLPADQPGALDLAREQVRRLVRERWEGLVPKLRAVRALRDERLDDVRGFLTSWVENARLSRDRVMGLLMEAWEQEGSERTLYGALNALTRVASHEAERLPDRYPRILSRLAGILAFRSMHFCPRCFRAIREPLLTVEDGAHLHARAEEESG